ncbi:MAG: fibrobacter succinogenes major paralogous domain-containing protein [Bacteroidetes bacterium]|nr:fibrobacter succinogenes major paralogous domain-containing protein [Bacteroidota bacterium]
MKQPGLRLFIASLIILTAMKVVAQVAINADGSAAASSAMLDVNSPNRGFLPPRMLLTAANIPDPVVSPVPGLIVYNTQAHGGPPNEVAPGIYSWNGSRWVPVSRPEGSNPGDMSYWNGTSWELIPAGSNGQSLVFCYGVPTWGGCFPNISTGTVSNIVQGTALSGGQVIYDGGTTVSARGVCWDTIAGPTTACSHTHDGTGSGTFQSVITGLAQNKTYYIRAYATNNRGDAYGTEGSFYSGCVQVLNVSISISASANSINAGTSVTFTATPVNGGASPAFQWKKNSVNIIGATNATYSYTPQNNDAITCTLSSGLASCITGNPALSNSIVMIVNPVGGSYCPGTQTVVYSGQTYNTVLVGTQCWLKENLNVGTKLSGLQNQSNNSVTEKYCFGNIDANCTVYGGLYQWDEAMQYVATAGTTGICPPGWHIPTDAEWTALSVFLSGAAAAGGKMKETGTAHWAAPNTGANNSSSFTALPGDYRDELGDFLALNYDAYFWSSSASTSTFAWSRYLINTTAEVFRDDMEKITGLSVRCIKN